MKKSCSIGRFVDWRKVALCLLSVAALNLQAGDVTVGVWIPIVPKDSQQKHGKLTDDNGFTPEQRFFLSYANVWAGSGRRLC